MSAIALPSRAVGAPSRLALAGEALVARGGLVLLALGLFVFLTVPLAMLFRAASRGARVSGSGSQTSFSTYSRPRWHGLPGTP